MVWMLLGFGAFMAVIWSVHSVNARSREKSGYEPFSLPNTALMLVANLLLLSALAPGGEVGVEGSATAGLDQPFDLALAVKLGAAGCIAAVTFWLIARRTGVITGMVAVVLLGALAVAILPSLIFMRIAGVAEAAAAGEDGEPESASPRHASRRPVDQTGQGDWRS
jgi:hypothetical protein